MYIENLMYPVLFKILFSEIHLLDLFISRLFVALLAHVLCQVVHLDVNIWKYNLFIVWIKSFVSFFL